MLENDFVKTAALFRIRQCRIKCSTRHAQRLRGDTNTPALQARESNPVTFTFVADQIGRRYPTILKQNLRGVRRVLAKFVFQARHDITGRGGWHPKGTDAPLAGGFIRHGHDNGNIGMLAAGDELLDAVNHITVTISPRGGAQRRGIATSMWLDQTKRAQHRASGQRRQPLLLLLGVGIRHADATNRTVIDRDDG